MYYKKLKFKKIKEYEDATELLLRFAVCLENNGQILKGYSLIENKGYELYVTTPHIDSLEDKYDSSYVKKLRNLVCENFRTEVVDIGENLESRSYCRCENRNAIEMQTYSRDIDSVFTCLGCGNPIALYELPCPEGSEDYVDILLWQENYSAMDRLWINCICDRYTGNQLVKPDSVLNKQGIELACEMSEKLGIPVYYHLECDYGRSVKAEKVGNEQIHICSKCNKIMKRIQCSEEHKIDICEDCKLSYQSH